MCTYNRYIHCLWHRKNVKMYLPVKYSFRLDKMSYKSIYWVWIFESTSNFDVFSFLLSLLPKSWFPYRLGKWVVIPLHGLTPIVMPFQKINNPNQTVSPFVFWSLRLRQNNISDGSYVGIWVLLISCICILSLPAHLFKWRSLSQVLTGVSITKPLMFKVYTN